MDLRLASPFGRHPAGRETADVYSCPAAPREVNRRTQGVLRRYREIRPCHNYWHQTILQPLSNAECQAAVGGAGRQISSTV